MTPRVYHCAGPRFARALAGLMVLLLLCGCRAEPAAKQCGDSPCGNPDCTPECIAWVEAQTRRRIVDCAALDLHIWQDEAGIFRGKCGAPTSSNDGEVCTVVSCTVAMVDGSPKVLSIHGTSAP